MASQRPGSLEIRIRTVRQWQFGQFVGRGDGLLFVARRSRSRSEVAGDVVSIALRCAARVSIFAVACGAGICSELRFAARASTFWAVLGAGISTSLPSPRIPYSFSILRSARRRIASGVSAVSGVSSRKRW